MTRRQVVLGAPAWGVAFTLACTRSGDRTSAGASTGRSTGEVRSLPDAGPLEKAAADRDAGVPDGAGANADAAPAPPPAAPSPHRRTAEKPKAKIPREIWPRPATVIGTEEQLDDLPRMEGVSVSHHGQHRVYPDRWHIEVVISNPRAVAALRARGIEVKLHDAPTEEELRRDTGPDHDPVRDKRRP